MDLKLEVLDVMDAPIAINLTPIIIAGAIDIAIGIAILT
jgi:hypothetical protein